MDLTSWSKVALEVGGGKEGGREGGEEERLMEVTFGVGRISGERNNKLQVTLGEVHNNENLLYLQALSYREGWSPSGRGVTKKRSTL